MNNFNRIGIFGGTFDPVHNQHVWAAKAALEKLSLDKLIIVPTFQPPHKKNAPTCASLRLEMLKLAFANENNIEISDYEIINGGRSFTYLTVEHFKSLYPDAKLFFIVGDDMLTDFKTWKLPERILSACELAVLSRKGMSADYSAEKEYFFNRFGKEFITAEFNGENLSSTKIRTYARFGLPINDFVPNAVAQFIQLNNVYPDDVYIQYLKNKLPLKRYVHTANVVYCALSKSKELSLDCGKISVAATLHDMAKYTDFASVKGFTLPETVPSPVVHAFLGAFLAQTELGVTDNDVINAIRYHTSGRADMSNLEKLIFVADMIEEGRNYEGVDKLREFYEKDFQQCFYECLKEETRHLFNKGKPIFIETLNAYDFYIKNSKGEI